jgi:hypothetical protein
VRTDEHGEPRLRNTDALAKPSDVHSRELIRVSLGLQSPPKRSSSLQASQTQSSIERRRWNSSTSGSD